MKDKLKMLITEIVWEAIDTMPHPTLEEEGDRERIAEDIIKRRYEELSILFNEKTDEMYPPELKR